jgi:hypothetical protein
VEEARGGVAGERRRSVVEGNELCGGQGLEADAAWLAREMLRGEEHGLLTPAARHVVGLEGCVGVTREGGVTERGDRRWYRGVQVLWR